MTVEFWFLIGAALVFWMQAGFAMVETGFTRAKNAGNIIMKNLMDFCIGTVVFSLLGYTLMMALVSWAAGRENGAANTFWLYSVICIGNILLLFLLPPMPGHNVRRGKDDIGGHFRDAPPTKTKPRKPRRN